MQMHFDQQGRSGDIRSEELLTIPVQRRLHLVPQLAAQSCDASIAVLMLVRDGRQWFSSSFGVENGCALVDSLFNDDIIRNATRLVVADTTQDRRFAGHPDVRFCTGVPLLSSAGETLGALAVMDTKPRAWTSMQQESLDALAEQVVMQIEFRQLQLERQNARSQQDPLNIALQQIAGHAAHMGGWQIDLPSMRLAWTDEVADILAIPAHTSISPDMSLRLLTPEYRDTVLDHFLDCVRDGTPWDIEAEATTFGERRIWVRLIGQAVRTAAGKIVGVQGAYQDITDRKAAEIALMETHRGLVEAQRIGRIGSWTYDIPTDRLRFSKEGIRIFGGDTSLPFITNAQMLRMLHPDDIGYIKGQVRRAKEGLRSFDFEHRVRWADGQSRIIHTKGEVSFGPDGRAISLSGTVQDITEKKAAEVELRRSEQRFMHLADAMPQIVWVADGNGEITYINKLLSNNKRAPREDLSPHWANWVHPEDLEHARVAWRRTLDSGTPQTAEFRLFNPLQNEYRWHIVRSVPIHDEYGAIVQWYGTATDIDAGKRAALQLIISNRALQTLSRCNEALLRIDNEQELLEQVCHIAKDVGGYRMCWVGYVDDELGNIFPRAYAGDEGSKEFFETEPQRWSGHDAAGTTSVAKSVRMGQPFVFEDLSVRRHFSPPAEAALARGYSGVVSLPLRDKNHTFGVLVLYHGEVRKVEEDELRLLQELADNLAFGITSIRAKVLQHRTEQAIVNIAAGVTAHSGKDFFQQLTHSMVSALEADIGLIARIVPGERLYARTLSVVIDGERADNFDYDLAGAPCEDVYATGERVVVDKVAELYPLDNLLAQLDAKSYVGMRIDDHDGYPVGIILVIYRKPLEQPSFVTSTLRIFVERAAAELKRQEAEAVIRDQASLLEKARDAIIVGTMDHRVQFWNKSAEHLYGWTREEALDSDVRELLYGELPRFPETMEVVLQHGEWVGERLQRRKDGSTIIVESRLTLVRDEEGRPKSVLALNTDITRRKTAEQEIQRLAFYDQLTQLPNRQLMLDRLTQALASCRRNHQTGALMFIDLDNFKTLNDTFGHDKGDELLRQVAKRLTATIRECDSVARLGGDEFVVILQALSEELREARGQAEAIAVKILDVLNQPYQLENYEHRSTPSIGVVLFTGSKKTVEELLKRADLAMYQAKAAGKNAVRFFDPVMQAAVTTRNNLEEDLRRSLLNDGFVLHFQPQIDCRSRIIGVEALVRWNCANRGLVYPGGFISVAEESGLIIPLGELVLEKACTQLAAWASNSLLCNLGISVNVSSRQFKHAGFVQKVFDILERTGANPSLLKLELTESVVIDNVDELRGKMQTLKQRGIGFSMDDFGTGYSSLFYLKSLPLDQLKIDRSFVRDILTDESDAVIVRTIIALSKSLKLDVIAEGVETAEQLHMLSSNGCDAYQGYLYAKPLALEAFEAFVAGYSASDFSPIVLPGDATGSTN